MLNQLRYVLHRNKGKYNDVTTPLYITSQESTVWQKVGQQVLQIKGEDWRLLDSILVEHIPTAKLQTLGIKLLQPEEVVDLIRELGANYVDGNSLELSERYELLRYISQRPSNQDLWKALQVHETINRELVCIEAGRTYLENQNFPLDERLQKYIVLIRQNKQEINQDWIPLWTANEAITTILNRPNPYEYYDLILNALQQLSTSDKEEWKTQLKQASWLPSARDTEGISPQHILRLPIDLAQHQQVIASLDITKHPENTLSTQVLNHHEYYWLKKLFMFWNAKTIIEKVFSHSEKSISFWNDFCNVILDALQNLSVPENLETVLKTEQWLLVDGRLITPEQVIEIVPKVIKQHLSTLVELSVGEYVEFVLLPDNIKSHKNLRKLFSKWNENDVINFLLIQSQPHSYLNIILNALNCLFSNPASKLSLDNDQNLRIKAWLADAQGNAIYPQNVIYYPSIETEIEELLLAVNSSYIASSQLDRQIRNCESCWQWLTKELFLTQDKALLQVGRLLNQALDYKLGEFELDEFPLDKILLVFEKIDVSFLPAWTFAQKIDVKDKFRQYLLPNLLGYLNEENLIKILQNLVSLKSEPEESTVNIFNYYLKLAVDYDTFLQNILGQIHLLNRRGQWQTPDKLTWGNMENIDGAYLLNNEQASIICSHLNDLQAKDSSTVSQTPVVAIDKSNFDVLQSYFQSWQQYCPSEPIGAFLSLLHGGEGNVKSLAHLYLGKRDLGILRQRLLENRPISTRAFRIYVGQASERTREVCSIMGFTFRASLVDTQNPPHLFVSKLTPDARELELLPIQPQQFTSSKLINLLKNSTGVLLKNVYEVSPSSLNQIWKDLENSDQLDIQVAKNLLLDTATHILRELGVENKSPIIKKLFKQFDELRWQQEELKQQNRSVESIEKRIKQITFELSNLLEGESSESEQLKEQILQTVRNKIESHGYRYQSIPFELFQNADDAAIEWMYMSSNQILEKNRKQFIVVWTENQILFIHAGRPIGCFQHPDCPDKQYRDRGFHRDLEKMLTFNISDKGEGVTGKFGLGFKSVYLACKRPYVLSKNLGFTVEGGLLPSRLNPEKTSELRGELKRYTGLLDATIVELALEENVSWQNVLSDFLCVASILLVFSKGIKTCKLVNNSYQETTLSWDASPVLNISGVETGKYQTTGGNQDSILLCLKTGEETKATLLLGIFEQKGRLYNALPKNIPTFWVTAPTRERHFLGFVLNANFEINTGRESLVKSSVRNCELAQSIGKGLGEVLYNLFRRSEGNWQALAKAFPFNTIDEYEFWNFLWEELAVRWQQKDPSEAIDIIRHMLAGDRAMGYLITRCQSLPNGLYGRYRQLISLDNVRYRVRGKLSEQRCFLEVANWTNFQRKHQNSLIASNKWEEVKQLLGTVFDGQRYAVSDLRLVHVLKNEIESNQLRVPLEQARYIGKLISKEFLNSFSASPELNELQSTLDTYCFMSKNGTYLQCQQLLINSSNLSEEKLLASFAPDSRILHPDYQGTALDFFYACRQRRNTVGVEELARWALQAKTNDQRQAVHVYLLEGEQRDKLAPILYASHESSWIANDKSIIDCLLLMAMISDQRTEVLGTSRLPDITTPEEAIDEDYNPFFEIRTNCTQNDFDIERSPEEIEAFARMLLEGLNRQHSFCKGYVYHFTHIENAASILRGEKLLARNFCPDNFKNSAGVNLINRTREDVKNFARFYFRPKTPTQWHNEGLGKRRKNIYALCPVPIFFRFNLKQVLKTHGSRCAVSSGNLAASGSYYGNSTAFLEQGFDFNNVYSTLQRVGKETFLRASQQEFIIFHELDFDKLITDDITIICRSSQDKQTLINLLGNDSKYINRIFEEEVIFERGNLFYHENPSVIVQNQGKFINIEIDKYEAYQDVIHGELILRLNEQTLSNREIISLFCDISKIVLGQPININSSRCIQLDYLPNTCMSIYFQENNQKWLIYTNES
jgi:hypothetical protein